MTQPALNQLIVITQRQTCNSFAGFLLLYRVFDTSAVAQVVGKGKCNMQSECNLKAAA